MTVELRPATAAHFARLLSGEAPSAGLTLPDTPLAEREVLAMLAGLAERMEAVFSPAAWMIISGQRVAGLLSLTSEPADGVLTIGYGVAPSEQGQGAASGAVAAFLEWARRDPRITAVVAETRTDNVPSQRVLESNGFVRTGERRDDEDGDLFCWRAAC